MSVFTFMGLTSFGISGFFGYRFWTVTKDRRAVNSAIAINSKDELSTRDGQYVYFEGRVQSDNPFQSLYVLNDEGKPLQAPIYLMEEYKWVEVLEEVKLLANPAINSNFGNYFKKTEWVPKEQLLKKITVIRDFTVTSKKRGTVVPTKVKKSLSKKEFPLLKKNHVYTPPNVLSTSGSLLARIYETGIESKENYLAVGSKVTIVGKIKNQDGKTIIGPEENKPYIITNLSYKEIKRSYQTKGVPELSLTVGSFVLGVALIAFGSSESSRRRF